MKKFFVLLTVAGMLYSTSCSESYDDSTLWGRVDDLENRVARLEELCKQMNTNIASLQTLVSAAQAHDCITSVVPVESGGNVVGYTITFSQNAPITIYHGANGADGTTPVIGAKQNADGIYYWTLDGEWLLDENGAKIPTQGPTGNDGQNGVTPRLKIENGGWYVSYNNGATWTYLGLVPSGGTVAASDSMFRSVDTSHSDYVLFTLSDGTEIRVPRFGMLAITFTPGNSLKFDIDETKTVNYTITGGGANNVVKAELQNPDDNYTLHTLSTSATQGTITIATKIPTKNNVIVSVSDGVQTIMTAIAVSIKPSFSGNTIAVETPGTLGKLLADYDKTTITELTLIGNLSSSDISILNRLPNLAVLDMENVNLETLSDKAFWNNQSLTSVKLPRTLKTIGKDAFINCRSLTSVTIGNSVTEIGDSAFWGCGLTNVTIPDSVTTICNSAFAYCNLISVTIGNSVKTIFSGAFTNYVSLASIYCKAQTPPIMESGDAFNGVATSTLLYVPIGCAGAYRAAEYWNKFTNINEMEFE